MSTVNKKILSQITYQTDIQKFDKALEIIDGLDPTSDSVGYVTAAMSCCELLSALAFAIDFALNESEAPKRSTYDSPAACTHAVELLADHYQKNNRDPKEISGSDEVIQALSKFYNGYTSGGNVDGTARLIATDKWLEVKGLLSKLSAMYRHTAGQYSFRGDDKSVTVMHITRLIAQAQEYSLAQPASRTKFAQMLQHAMMCILEYSCRCVGLTFESCTDPAGMLRSVPADKSLLSAEEQGVLMSALRTVVAGKGTYGNNVPPAIRDAADKAVQILKGSANKAVEEGIAQQQNQRESYTHGATQQPGAGLSKMSLGDIARSASTGTAPRGGLGKLSLGDLAREVAAGGEGRGDQT